MRNVIFKLRRHLIAAALVTAALLAPVASRAQVVVVANGSPITELDIQQRTKLTALTSQKTPTRQEVINELIDDRIKIAKAKTYSLEVSESELDTAFEGMAKRQHMTVAQFGQVLERSGLTPRALKDRIRSEMTWSQLVRGKFGSTLQIGDSDIAVAMKSRNEADEQAVGYIYTLYPITIVAARGSSEGLLQAKLGVAENLRNRFTSCKEGLPMARALRDVAVREPINRNSSDLPPQMRELLDKIEVGHLTPPEPTAQGLDMFALCEKKTASGDSPAKRSVREELFNKRFESESKKFLDEIRKQAMIEYK